MFSCDYCETFNNIYFEERLQTVAFVNKIKIKGTLMQIWKSSHMFVIM